MGAMEEGDAAFGSGAEAKLDFQLCSWHDKYRSRKPKYFNSVHIGYERNKYNQTHYDHRLYKDRNLISFTWSSFTSRKHLDLLLRWTEAVARHASSGFMPGLLMRI
ncbi:Cactin [Melia azedarach]|uniref:Cactin n=1 Tax=Melia azedarach TaxID=155640 RepID=A0ACC1YL04_MELAZ|nr:Cactin [Melia azedarach]